MDTPPKRHIPVCPGAPKRPKRRRIDEDDPLPIPFNIDHVNDEVVEMDINQ